MRDYFDANVWIFQEKKSFASRIQIPTSSFYWGGCGCNKWCFMFIFLFVTSVINSKCPAITLGRQT